MFQYHKAAEVIGRDLGLGLVLARRIKEEGDVTKGSRIGIDIDIHFCIYATRSSSPTLF
jgi:hypothetical protein